MEEYSYLWGAFPSLPEFSQTYYYDQFPTSGFYNYGLHEEIDTHHGLGVSNDTFPNPISTPGKVLIDDFTNSSKAPSEPDQTFFDGVDEEVELLISKEDTSNSTLENNSPLFLPENICRDANPDVLSLDDIPNYNFSYGVCNQDPDETKAFQLADQNAQQGLPQPSPKRDRRMSEPKDKSWSNKVSKVVSATEVDSDPWAWKKYGKKYLKSIERLKSYYKCANSASYQVEKCDAKRHVNESCTHPNACDVIYIGQHNHTPPTHKSPIRKRTRYIKIKKEEECWSN